QDQAGRVERLPRAGHTVGGQPLPDAVLGAERGAGRRDGTPRSCTSAHSRHGNCIPAGTAANTAQSVGYWRPCHLLGRIAPCAGCVDSSTRIRVATDLSATPCSTCSRRLTGVAPIPPASP